MSELTIVTLCHVLSNLTHNRCSLVENSNTCRCIGDVIEPISPTVIVSAAPDIMLSEVCLILFVLTIWLSAIGFCLNQYKSLRRLETQVHYCIDRKDPLNIGDIKIVTREQDSIIYKKKRYSTLIDTHIGSDDLKAMHYAQQYLPRTPMKTISSALSALVICRNDLTSTIPLSVTTGFDSSMNIPFSTHDERLSNAHRTENTRHSTALTVPHIAIPNSLQSSWDTSQMYEASCSTQHLSVPTTGLRSNRYSDGNISLPVPQITPDNPQTSDEQLLDPRLIPPTVRRSLLALHRESQENINMYKRKDQTQSENDVHGAFAPWKIKMKSKLKRTHPELQQPSRPHSNTLSILPIRLKSNDYDRYVTENLTVHNEYQQSTPPSQRCSPSTTPIIRRSLKHCSTYSTQSTSESETTQGELSIMTSLYIPANDDKIADTIIEGTEQFS